MAPIVYTKIVGVTEDGITVAAGRNRAFIDFRDCAGRYAAERPGGSGRCVAVRDVTALTFTFYTCPKTAVAFRPCPLAGRLFPQTAAGRFRRLQKAIERAGYTSLDLS